MGKNNASVSYIPKIGGQPQKPSDILGSTDNFNKFLARDIIYTSRAYATMSVSVCLSVHLSVTDVHYS